MKQVLTAGWRKYRWKFVAGVFLYYLVRDTILYILIPFLILRGLLF